MKLFTFLGIEYDDFITLQPDHIKEAIPELVPRIKFQNLFKNFIESVADLNKAAVFNDSFNIANNSYVDENEILNLTSCVLPNFDENTFSMTDDAPEGSFQILSTPDVLIRAPEEIKTKITTVQVGLC